MSNRLSVDFSLPGQPGYEMAKTIDRLYGDGGGQAPAILVVTAPAGGTLLVAWLGEWNWWLPHPVARVLRIPPPLPAER